MFIIITILFILSPLIISLIVAFAGSRKLRIQDIELSVHKKQRFERIRWILNEYIPSRENPVIFLRGAVLKDRRTGKNLLQLKFINTGKRAIKSVYTSISFVDDAGDLIANGSAIQAEYLDINCESKATFGQKQLLDLGNIGATRICVMFSKIVFTDGTVWRAEQGAEIQRPAKLTWLKNTLPPELQNEISEELICKPEILSIGLWRCSCGCLADNGASCPNCQKTFEQAQEDINIDNLNKRSQQRLAEQKRKDLDAQIAKKEYKSYINQLVFAILMIYLGTGCFSLIILFLEKDDVISEITVAVLLALYAGMCFVSMIATSILVKKSRKDGSIKDAQSVRKIVRTQEVSALVVLIINILCILIPVIKVLSILTHKHPSDWYYYLEDTIFFILLALISYILTIGYCIQLPPVQSWLSKRKRKKEG